MGHLQNPGVHIISEFSQDQNPDPLNETYLGTHKEPTLETLVDTFLESHDEDDESHDEREISILDTEDGKPQTIGHYVTEQGLSRKKASQSKMRVFLVDRDECRARFADGGEQKIERLNTLRAIMQPKYIVLPNARFAKPQLSRLAQTTPAARTLIEEIERYVDMTAKLVPAAFHLENLLLVGPPGTGKTHFANKLFGALGLVHHKLALSEAQDGFYLSGSQRGYANSMPGRVADRLAARSIANPGFVLDEIDKVSWYDGGSGRKGHLAAVLQLLERDTAREFRDLSLDLPIDASRCSWVCTANDIEAIPDAVLSRLRVVEMPAPDGVAMCGIAESIFSDVLFELFGEDRGIGVAVDPEAADVLDGVTPRALKRAARDIVVRKLCDESDYVEVSADDLYSVFALKKRKQHFIGFVDTNTQSKPVKKSIRPGGQGVLGF